MAMAGGRFFGWVTGGSLPATVAANWLAAAWDQNTAGALVPAGEGWRLAGQCQERKWGERLGTQQPDLQQLASPPRPARLPVLPTDSARDLRKRKMTIVPRSQHSSRLTQRGTRIAHQQVSDADRLF